MKTLHDAIFSPWMPLDPVSVLLRRKFRGGGGASGAYYTLTGTLPLTLPHSLAAAIKSLVRTGAMTQSPAPTPSAPVYPSINNGVVQMVDPDLPAGYKRLTGISFDGNFHYETGEALTSDDDVTMTLANPSSSGTNVFGSYNGGASRTNFSFYIIRSSSSGSYFRFGNQLKRPVYGGTEQRTITFGAGGTSGFMVDASVDPDEFTTPANVYIGMLPNSSSAAYTGDIVGSILVSTRLEWIPCEDPGGVIGYYERVNGNFIAPTGDGTPVSLGYDNSHLVPRVVGDTEVLTVSGKNLLKLPTFDEVTSMGQVANYWNIPIKLAPNTTYYVSSHYLNDYTSVGKNMYVLITADATANTDYATIAHRTVGIRNRDLTTGNSGYLYFRVSGATTRALYEEMLANTEAQLELGSAATSYEPYREPQTATVPDLFAVGDYRDEVDVVAGPKTRRVGMKVLDGTEPFSLYQSSCWAANVFDDHPKVSGNALSICSHYAWTTSSVSGMADGTFQLNGTARLCIKDSRFETATQFRAELAAQYAAGTPVIIWYPLATPTTESITPQALRTVDGTTVVSSSAGSVGASVEYKASEEPTAANTASAPTEEGV